MELNPTAVGPGLDLAGSDETAELLAQAGLHPYRPSGPSHGLIRPDPLRPNEPGWCEYRAAAPTLEQALKQLDRERTELGGQLGLPCLNRRIQYRRLGVYTSRPNWGRRMTYFEFRLILKQVEVGNLLCWRKGPCQKGTGNYRTGQVAYIVPVGIPPTYVLPRDVRAANRIDLAKYAGRLDQINYWVHPDGLPWDVVELVRAEQAWTFDPDQPIDPAQPPIEELA